MQNRANYFMLPAWILSFMGVGCDTLENDTTQDKVTISGSVFAGNIKGAEIVVTSLDGKMLAGPVTASSEGDYSLPLGKDVFAEDFIIASTGGELVDEATGNAAVPTGKLSAFVASGTLGQDSAVHLTPASTILCQLKSSGKEGLNADSVFKQAFGFNPDLSNKPVSAAIPSTSSPESKRLAGLRVAAFSQLNQDLGLAPSKQFELLEILARDLSDGKLNGKDGSKDLPLPSSGSLPEDIQNRFERALLKFYAGHKDSLGLTPDKIGVLPFGKIALTDPYRIEYVEGMMPAKQGRTSFKIKVTERESGSPVSGLAMQWMPTMYMATHQHSTPMGKIKDNGDGYYTGDIYYLMASAMKSKSMGYWELKVGLGAESKPVFFYPLVTMGMGGDSVRATLKGISDKTADMGMAAPRTYFLFNNGLAKTGEEYGFEIFLATKENMMSFPAVYGGMSLKDEKGEAWDIDSLTVAASSDGKAWVEAKDLGDGRWQASGLGGMNQDGSSTIRVKVIVNGEQKTVDGLPLVDDESNGYATFSVTPRK